MAGQRYRQAGFWRFRWAKCWNCSHVDKYAVTAKPGMRLRHQLCAKCRVVLGRHAGTRAGPQRKLALEVEQLARKMGIKDAQAR